MAAVQRIYNFIFGPTLYKHYKDGSNEMYQPIKFEKWGDRGIYLIKTIWSLGIYTSPLAAIIIYRKGFGVFESLYILSRFLVGIGIMFTLTSYTMRGISRLNNPVYVQFYDTWKTSQKKKLDGDAKKKLMLYDFDFSAWPVEFSVADRKQISAERPSPRRSALESFVSIPCRVASYLTANYIALKMIYPGSVKLLQSLMFSNLLQGRVKLVEEYNAERFKIEARDKNHIDVIFVDRRGEDDNPNGRTLVIVCEGNCGFYEIGCMFTPLEAKYSVVGWNHPGFGGSTGTPSPAQEQNAIEAVMQFSMDHLGFRPSQIIIYGWSIGGYTSSWAAMNFPDIKGLILDATFDDILPLALARMPRALDPLIRRVIREYVNLTVYENIAKYPGPVTFIRRAEDEMICTEDGVPSTNRGNNLVAKFLKHRYPKIVTDKRQVLLDKWLASDALRQAMMRDEYHVDKDFCSSILASYVEENSPSYPMQIGDGLTEEQKSNLTLFLAEKYMKEYRSTHCTPLPVNMFRQPWAPSATEAGFVKV